MLFGFLIQLFSGKAQKTNPIAIGFNKYPVYTGRDLGLTYSATKSVFRIWSPTAEKAELLLYKDGTVGSPATTVPMQKSNDGTWIATQTGDKKGLFYTFRVMIGKKWNNEVPDPYAKSVG